MKPLIIKTHNPADTQAEIEKWKEKGFNFAETFAGSGGIEYFIAQGRDQLERQNTESNTNAIAQFDLSYGPIIQQVDDGEEGYTVVLLYARNPIGGTNKVDTTDLPGGKIIDVEAQSDAIMRSAKLPSAEELMSENHIKTFGQPLTEEQLKILSKNQKASIPTQGKYYTISKSGVQESSQEAITELLTSGHKPVSLDQAKNGALKKKGNILIIKGEIIIPGFVL